MVSKVSNGSLFQVVMRLNEQTAKFCDKIDRLYITDESFDLSLIFSESIISTSSGLIAMLDKESSDLVPHYITELGAIRIVWRTVVQITDSRDTRAAGFRMLSYTDGRVKCFGNFQIKSYIFIAYGTIIFVTLTDTNNHLCAT